MKHARPVFAAMVLTLVCSVGIANACEQHQKTSAAAASVKSSKKITAVTADASGSKMCTPEQMAACQGAKGASAVTASSSSCGSKSMSAVTASSSSCGAKGVKATNAVTASAEHAGCASKTSAVNTVAAGSGSCASKGAGVSAMAAGAGASCSGHGMAKAAGKSAHAECAACTDMSACGDELSAAGAHTQVVPLKNGVMFVYTADSPGQITAVQSAMARRGERMAQLVTAGDKARLCTECKSLRTAMANGRLNREVVNIEGGALTLMTSEDASVVAKIHAMVDTKSYSRTKS